MARVKNIEAFCINCNTVTKMEIVNETVLIGGENKRWAKCKKCKQTTIIDMENDVMDKKPSLDGIENEDCTVYSPSKSFQIGESIYHKEWDDFGRVVSKETLSNGQKSISVEFQKSGNKKLIESLS